MVYTVKSFQAKHSFPTPIGISCQAKQHVTLRSEGLSSKATCDTMKWRLFTQNNGYTLWSTHLSIKTTRDTVKWHLFKQSNLSQCHKQSDILSSKATCDTVRHLVKQHNLSSCQMKSCEAKQRFQTPNEVFSRKTVPYTMKWTLLKQHNVFSPSVTSCPTMEPFSMPSDVLWSKALCDTVKRHLFKQNNVS